MASSVNLGRHAGPLDSFFYSTLLYSPKNIFPSLSFCEDLNHGPWETLLVELTMPQVFRRNFRLLFTPDFMTFFLWKPRDLFISSRKIFFFNAVVVEDVIKADTTSEEKKSSSPPPQKKYLSVAKLMMII